MNDTPTTTEDNTEELVEDDLIELFGESTDFAAVEIFSGHSELLDFSQEEGSDRLLFSASQLSVSAETGHYIAMSAVLCAKGQIRNALNQPGPFEFTEEALNGGVQQGLFDSIACFVDHSWMPSMHQLLGTWQRATYEGGSVRSTLHIYKTAANQSVIDTLQALKAEKAAGNAIPDVGISIVCYPVIEESAAENSVRRITSFRTVESADLVFKPAVTTARIDMSSKQGETAPMPKLDELQTPGSAVDTTAPAPNVTAPPATLTVTNPDHTEVSIEVDTTELDAQLERIRQATASADAWNRKAQAFAADQMIANSGLLPEVQAQLRKSAFASPEDLEATIVQHQVIRDAYASQAASTVINTRAPITAASIAAGAIGATEIADGAIDAATFAAGAITATVIADGAIDAATFAASAITATVIAADAFTAAKFAADVTTEFQTGLPTAAGIADAVWDEARASHTALGSFGEGVVLNSTAANAITATSLAADTLTAAKIAADVTTELQAGLATAASITALNNLSAAQVNTEVDTALFDIHLDHLLATDYDPAAKPGTATALLNELVESNAGVSRYTAAALVQAPTAPTAAVVADAVWDEAQGPDIPAQARLGRV